MGVHRTAKRLVWLEWYERRGGQGYEVRGMVAAQSRRAAWVWVRTLTFALSKLGAMEGFDQRRAAL